jgi:hypothetical protein
MTTASNAAQTPPDAEWLRLVLYKSSLWGGYTSLVPDPNFFFAADGRTNPEAELQATIAAFQSPVTQLHLDAEVIKVSENSTGAEVDTSQQAHPLCRFPARLEYALRHSPELAAKLPKIQCARLAQFRSRTNVSKVSLVFSSYFMGNPASSFGHTLLRLHNKKFAGTDSELLDTAIGFAAFPTVTNPVLYAFMGLAGLFPGGFSAEPYYRKVRAYNDQEARDLWSYELKLTPQEMERLVNVVWEFGDTFVNYYYFTVNCGTLLMDVLDAAAPRLNVRSRIPFYVIPSDVVRAVSEEPGLVAGRKFRPSVRYQFVQRLNQLSRQEEELFWQVAQSEDPGVLAQQPEASRVRVLDAWADYLEYKFAKKLVAGDEKASGLKQKALSARAGLRLPSSSLAGEPTLEAPDLQHPVRRLTVGGGGSNALGARVNLQYRFALHGLVDAQPGLPTNTELTFFELSGSFQQAPVFLLEELSFFRVSNLNPWKRYERPFSFRAGLGLFNLPDPDFVNPATGHAISFGGGYGITIPVFTDRVLLYAMAALSVNLSWDYKQGWIRPSAGPLLGTFIHLSPYTKLRAEVSQNYRAFADQVDVWQVNAEAQTVLYKNLSVFASVLATPADTRAQAGLRWFH